MMAICGTFPPMMRKSPGFHSVFPMCWDMLLNPLTVVCVPSGRHPEPMSEFMISRGESIPAFGVDPVPPTL